MLTATAPQNAVRAYPTENHAVFAPEEARRGIPLLWMPTDWVAR